jgi:hypothetical protein
MKRSLLGPLAMAVLLAGYLLSPPLRSSATGGIKAKDPGVRSGLPSAGEPIDGLSLTQLAFFNAGKEEFQSEEGVAEGLGPRMNLDSCAGCHSYPSAGGASPFVNPQVAFAKKNGAANAIPPFVTSNGPVREARLIKYPDGNPDGGVQALFTIAGRSDAPGCASTQPDFNLEAARNNIALRIPTPLFGAGLIEQIPDSGRSRGQIFTIDSGINA